MVWLVIGGPAAVVVAAIATAVIAVRGADVVLSREDGAVATTVRPTPTTPALEARNHAAAVR
jgi:hypothetical protein